MPAADIWTKWCKEGKEEDIKDFNNENIQEDVFLFLIVTCLRHHRLNLPLKTD